MSSPVLDKQNLPAGWILARIGDVVEPLETANPRASGPGTFQCVDIEAVDNRNHRIATPKTLPRAAPPSRARHVIRARDVIISLVRPRLKNIAIVPPELDAQWASTAFCVCRPREGISTAYLHAFFVQDSFVQAIKTYGDSPPSGHDDDLLDMRIPLPPPAEQLRIADRIDELFTDLAAGVTALERVKRNLARYRAAVLHAAVTGRLTAAWRKQHGPPAEPALKFLERILTARREHWEQRTLAKYKKDNRTPPTGWRDRYPIPETPRPSASRPAPELPTGWCLASLDQVSFLSSGTTPKRGVPAYWSNGTIPWIASSAVNEPFVDTPTELVPAIALQETTLKRYDVGTLLIALYGEGKTRGKVTELRITATVNQALAAITWFDGSFELKDFVKTTLASMYHALRREAAGGVQPNLNVDLVSKTLLPLPPLAEQVAILEVVTEKLSQIDGLEAEIERGLARASRLRQAILKAAFAGELVPQDSVEVAFDVSQPEFGGVQKSDNNQSLQRNASKSVRTQTGGRK